MDSKCLHINSYVCVTIKLTFMMIILFNCLLVVEREELIIILHIYIAHYSHCALMHFLKKHSYNIIKYT